MSTIIDSTPVSDMGLAPEKFSLLTPKAKKLHKGELAALATPQADAVSLELGLKANDIQSIHTAFSGYVHPMAAGGVASLSCCSCTPCCCCCAVAVVNPIQEVA